MKYVYLIEHGNTYDDWRTVSFAFREESHALAFLKVLARDSGAVEVEPKNNSLVAYKNERWWGRVLMMRVEDVP